VHTIDDIQPSHPILWLLVIDWGRGHIYIVIFSQRPCFYKGQVLEIQMRLGDMVILLLCL
jgi:hypothetical protein